MARVQNVSGQSRLLPWLGGRMVLPGQIVDVPDEQGYSYTCQEQTWAAADDATAKLHKAQTPKPDKEQPDEPAPQLVADLQNLSEEQLRGYAADLGVPADQVDKAKSRDALVKLITAAPLPRADSTTPTKEG